MYDIIGDIHGCFEPLLRLLDKLGYEKIKTSYRHPEGRKVLFVGDIIDRGADIFQVVRLVRAMEEAGDAIALMGNHEFNALAYHTPDGRGGYCRPHLAKNKKQHEQTLGEIALTGDEWSDHLDWMLTLPLFYEEDGLRAVHACWDEHAISKLKSHLGGNCFQSFDQVVEASDQTNELYRLVEDTLKGKEMKLPDDLTFSDKDGHVRHEIRVKWWEDPQKVNLIDYSVVCLKDLPKEPTQSDFDFYKLENKPVFFGHYWLQGEPILQKPNVCCLDYSIAKGGDLVAYRWDGEQVLDAQKFQVVT